MNQSEKTASWYAENWLTENSHHTQSENDDNFFKATTVHYLKDLKANKTPFFTQQVPPPLQYNPVNGRVYDGINQLILSMEKEKNKYEDSRWVSSDLLRSLNLQSKLRNAGTLIVNRNNFKENTHNSNKRYEFLYNVSQLPERDRQRFLPVESVQNQFHELTNKYISYYKENTGSSIIRRTELVKAAFKSNNDMPKFTATAAEYLFCQRLHAAYVPIFKPEELMAEFGNVVRTKGDQITQAFSRSCYYADKAVNSYCNKNRFHQQERELTNINVVTKNETQEQARTLSLNRSM